jgi:hypothetical protein
MVTQSPPGTRRRRTLATVALTAMLAPFALTAGWSPSASAGPTSSSVKTYGIWRPYHDHTYVGSDNGRPRQTLYEEFSEIARRHPDLVKPVVFGHSLRGVPIVALRITKDARSPRNPDGSRPSVGITATQHAREWLGTEQARRLTYLLLDNYGHRGPAIGTDGKPVAGTTADELTHLVDTREIWVVPVANPDGYDQSFTPGNRQWRKNVRDTNHDGKTEAGDGVDLNRNFPASWGLDEEGSSSDAFGETYRGSAPSSEPETRAMEALMKRARFRFMVNYHVTPLGERVLYGVGYQSQTVSEDDPISRALAGTNERPAIGANAPGAPRAYRPGLLSHPFRNNGIMDDTSHTQYGILGFTVELDEANPARGGGGSIFEFQDNDADVQQVFTKNVPFALDVIKSAPDPANPVSHLGNTAPDFQPHSFAVSYGSPQPVGVNVKRQLGKVRVHWRVNGGREHRRHTREYRGGQRYGGDYNRYYHEMRGTVVGARPGDRVEVWFSAGGRTSEHFSYEQRSDSGKPVLIMAAEDYSGQPGSSLEQPAYSDRTKPNYLRYYTDALKADRIGYDVYDVDAEGRRAPDPLGVLGHYRAVIWYTGNDSFIRGVGAPGGTGTSKLAADEILAVRDYLNNGGKLLYTGQNAAWAQNLGAQYNENGEPPYCHASETSPGTVENCSVLTDDFLQYWLGAYSHIDAASSEAEAAALPLRTRRGTELHLDGPSSADNQQHSYAAVTTSSVLGAKQFPQFASTVSIGIDRPSGFDPVTGKQYAVAQSDDGGFQRLRRTVDLRQASKAGLKFKMSYDTERNYDFVMVEAHHVGQDDWTTLPDVNGHTSTAVGSSCDVSNWVKVHPFMAHYQTNPDPARSDDCTGTGTTGSWNAATGNSRGYQDWEVDLSQYAGSQVEVSITYVQDLYISALGAFVDDVVLTEDGAAVASTSFEDGLGGFTAGPWPEGTEPRAGRAWTAGPTVGFQSGVGIQTNRSVYWGFGLEGVAGAHARATLIRGALRHLGVAHHRH